MRGSTADSVRASTGRNASRPRHSLSSAHHDELVLIFSRFQGCGPFFRFRLLLTGSRSSILLPLGLNQQTQLAFGPWQFFPLVVLVVVVVFEDLGVGRGS